MKTEPLHIVLASSSPRRRSIFERLGVACELAEADVDERAIPYKTPRELALKAALAKANHVAEARLNGATAAEGTPRVLVVGVDTIVVLDGIVYGKPTDEADARRMLAELTGRTHTVISGVALVEVGGTTLIDAVETDVVLRSATEDEIAEYVATGEPLDKAGSYALQGEGRRFVAEVKGDYFNVVGLPVSRLLEMMSEFTDTTAWARRAETLTGY
ncbi:septum formation protein Maf [candidate division BRC1 bacterium HGW-BRC1-1]|jgi:septum formation protein|nr:MAG: septum formation protein Maf [candidate division BRC1 bacterium HGW-BRC1-1]